MLEDVLLLHTILAWFLIWVLLSGFVVLPGVIDTVTAILTNAGLSTDTRAVRAMEVLRLYVLSFSLAPSFNQKAILTVLIPLAIG